MRKSVRNIIQLVALCMLITACSQEPVKIHYGSEECAHCRMMITDDRFAAQIITKKEKAIKFDAVECLAAYQAENEKDQEGAVYWFSNYENSGDWIKFENAVFIKSEVVKSPMGASLLSVSSSEEAEKHLQNQPGKVISWSEITNSNMKHH